jgi:biopolymer transport protein ExbD
MRFRNKQQGSSVPEVNLVPMMDVMMSVLTFFIITSMTLTSQRLANVNLPGSGAGGSEQKDQKPLVVGLNRQGEILLDNKAVSKAQLAEQMQSFLEKNPEGSMVLKADRSLPYEKVEELLKEMGKIGGMSVSLAIEQS